MASAYELEESVQNSVHSTRYALRSMCNKASPNKAQWVKNLPAMQETQEIPGLERSPGGGHGNPLHYPCLKESHGQRSLVGYSPKIHKESHMTEHEHKTRPCVTAIQDAHGDQG